MKLQTTTQEIKVVTAYYTPEEYLELEEKADYKNEYRDGEIISMTGGTTNHNKLALNLATGLNIALRDFQKIKYTVYKNDNHYEGEKAVAVGNRFLPPITMYCKCLHSKVNYYWSKENYY